jgi:GNAT superfamily N-acetyltransferase
MFTVITLPDNVDPELTALHSFAVDVDGDRVATGELYDHSWIGDETRQVISLRWTEGHGDAARAVLDASVERSEPGAELHLTANTEVHDRVDERVSLFESAGFTLWQEKQGFWFADDGQDLPPPEGITVRTTADFDRDRYIDVITACTAGTLDRVDADAIASMGARRWATTIFDSRFQPQDSWYVIENATGEHLGFVAPGAFDEENIGTIEHIGVVPEHRGHGYVDQLLRIANRAARSHGWMGMLSDVDVLNAPMIAAMRRNGHRDDVRPWHKWYYRRVK